MQKSLIQFIALLIVGFLIMAFIGCDSESTVNESTTKNPVVSSQPLCVDYEVLENGRRVFYKFSCAYHQIIENEETKFIVFFYEDGSTAEVEDLKYVMNGSVVFYSPDCD